MIEKYSSMEMFSKNEIHLSLMEYLFNHVARCVQLSVELYRV